VTEPVTESAIEPVTESAIEPVAESAIEPVTESAIEPVAEASAWLRASATARAPPSGPSAMDNPVTLSLTLTPQVILYASVLLGGVCVCLNLTVCCACVLTRGRRRGKGPQPTRLATSAPADGYDTDEDMYVQGARAGYF